MVSSSPAAFLTCASTASAVLLERDELGRHPHLDQRMRLRHLQRFFDDLDALALQHVGKARVVLEQRVIEFGDQRIVLPVPVLEFRRDRCRAAPSWRRGRCGRRIPAWSDGWSRRAAPDRGNCRPTSPRSGRRRHPAAPAPAPGTGRPGLRPPRRRDRASPSQCRARRAHFAGAGSFAGTTSFTAPAQPLWVRSNTRPVGDLYFAS